MSMSLKVLKNQNLPLNSLKTVTCMQVHSKRPKHQLPCVPLGYVSKEVELSTVLPRQLATLPLRARSGQRSVTRYIFVLFCSACYSQ